MTKNTDFKLPFNSLTNYVPQNLRNPVISSLIDNLFNRFLTHDESVPLYGYVGRKPSSLDDRAPRIPQSSVERDINSIVPVFNFQLGTERHAFTVEDLIRKAEAIGISAGNLQWLYSQGNNYLPPIDLDKFTNFFNYYWVAQALPATPTLAWNPDLSPEYYTIAAPLPSDLSKLNVRVATTQNTVLTGTGFNKLSFKLIFETPTQFRIETVGSLGEYIPQQTVFNLTTNNTNTDHFNFVVKSGTKLATLISFDIIRDLIYGSLTDGENGVVGQASFEAGDQFNISTDFLTRNYTVTFSGSNGVKGKIARVVPWNRYQEIDGVTVQAGDRVLVKDNADAGIYVVAPGDWTRATDFDGPTAVVGARTYVREGVENGGKIFESFENNGRLGFQVAPEPPGGYESNTNQWQEGNYWVSGDDLSSLGLTRANVIQALRPIIEYSGDLQLNGYVNNGRPSDSGIAYTQIKTEFNQLPLFDLYRYDGTHAGLVSSVFYYEEDVTADLDTKLQKRVLKSTNDSADFIFNHGMADDNGQLLFVKRGGKIKSIWHAGYNEPTIIDSTFTGAGNGTLVGLTAAGFTQQQVWTLTALTENTFSITASKMPIIPAPYDVVVVDQPYDNGEVAFTIAAGSIQFVPGDTFVFRVANLESPRYVYRNENDGIYDRFGGPAADLDGEGAWQVPRTFYNNPYNESRSPITEGVLYSHFRGILSNQLEGQPIDYSFGGSIKLWSEQQTLLASLLMQRDMTPISIIDLAQRQYETALNNVREIYSQNIVQYIADHGMVATYDELEALLAFVQSIRAQDNDVRTVLYDTTSPLTGFPATLPQLGIAELVPPGVGFDSVLGREVLTHHDGHKSLLFENDADLRGAILGNLSTLQIKRSDGSYTPAITLSATAPGNPYMGELWHDTTGQIMSYDVTSDTSAGPSDPTTGDRWYKRSTNELFTWSGATWVPEPNLSAPWTVVNFANVLNSLMLLVETKLYEGINPKARKFDFSAVMSDPEFLAQLQKELFAFSALNGYDPLASSYDETDPFTWNFSGAFPSNLPPMPNTEIPARWFNLLKAHQSTVTGVIPTERPNLEPWKLFNFETMSAWWNTLSVEKQEAYTPYVRIDEVEAPSMSVVAVKTVAGVTSLTGIPVIDGVQLQSGDRVLLQNESSPANNGVWVVNASGWSPVANTSTPGLVINVTSGSFKGSVWVLADVNGGKHFKQARLWSSELWTDVKVVRPTLRLSVNTATDELLPPRVLPLDPHAGDALTTVEPSSARDGYSFGEGSPVETVWSRSLEYNYSLARALFRYDPLAFLGFCWGFNWVEVDGILYDGVDMNMPGHKRFRLHGEPIEGVTRSAMTIAGTGTAVATYDAYDVHTEMIGADEVTVRAQSFTVKRDGVVLGQAEVGKSTTLGGLTFTLDDEGVPFRIGDRFEIANGQALFVPVATNLILGFGQTFTNALRETSIDTASSYAVSAFREWEVNMGYRAGGLVATDDLQVYTGSETLSESAFDLMFKKNQIARNEWLQALRVSVTQFGQTVPKEVGVAPATTGADWVFRVEGYNPRYTSVSFYDMSLDDNAIDFHALSKAHTDLTWYQPTKINGVITTNLPMTIIGIQNVVNFLFGYSRYAESRGWEFNQYSEFNIDAETGRTRNFQLEIEKYIDRCYAGVELGQGNVINPFIDRVWFNQTTGLLSEFIDTSMFDITGHPGVFDTLGVKFRKEDLDVVRTNTQSSFGASAPMYSVHAQVDEFEHLFIFNNYSQPSTNSGMLYDAFSGARVATYKFNGRKQATNTMRPEFGGHFLVGNQVHQNLQASTDNIANLYDANHAFENETTTRHALALLGFNRKQYFDDLDISEKTQFNFWRGLIQAKGTNLSIDAYLNNNRFDDAKIDEYWAYKLAEYGDARQRTYPELKLSVNDALTQFTRIQFDGSTLAPFGFDTVNSFDEARWFSIDDMNQDVTFKAEQVGTFVISNTDATRTYELPFVADALSSGNFTKINATTIKPTVSGQTLAITGYGPARPLFNPIKLFNYVDNELVAEIPVWHPAAGQHTPTALEGINIISDKNPAKYNYSKQAANNNAYDPLRPWGSKEVGRVWFDTRNLSYLPYYDQLIFGIDERLSRWGTLADFATVDVYEWVQSSVPPAEYDVLAQQQQGDAGLDPLTKAAGQVADKQTYVRERNWAMRPIAWSFSEIPRDVDFGATPPFPSGSFSTTLDLVLDDVTLTSGLAILNTGTFAKRDIVAGMRLGAWNNDPANPMPLSEYVIEDLFTKQLEHFYDGGLYPEQAGAAFNVRVEVTNHTTIAGQLTFSRAADQVNETLDENGQIVSAEVELPIAITAESGEITYAVAVTGVGTDTNETHYGATISVSPATPLIVDFPEFGLRVIATPIEENSALPIEQVRDAIVEALADEVTARDAAAVTMVVDGTFNPDVLEKTLDNDTETPVPGWRVWNVPTQAQLSADGQPPFSSWKPYVGEYSAIDGNLGEIQNAVSYAKSPLTLRNGVVVDRYKTTWSDWTVLKNVVLTYPSDETSYSAVRAGSSVTFTYTENFDSKATSVYVNGIAQLKASFSISGKKLIVNGVSESSKVTVIIRKYEPTVDELAFDPDAKDDLSFQQQYKEDYEYVALQVRDSEGALTSPVYFFWVKNKTTPALGKKQSVQSIAQQLREGPPNFLTFQNLSDDGNYVYDAITISGLSYVVTKNDTFKLRFTRNFTLRDDPQELDLKNVHTEWALMRPGQKTRVPESLWWKLTDSVVGADTAGNAVPAIRRVLYDERNGTRTQFGFGPEQTLAPSDLLRSSIADTIVNTKLIDENASTVLPDYITFLDLDESDKWFVDAESARKTMTDIWNQAKVAQVNEIFFSALNDVLASNYELSDIFKTSRISAYSIKVISSAPVAPTFE